MSDEDPYGDQTVGLSELEERAEARNPALHNGCNYYAGSVQEAIAECKRRRSFLVVFLKGGDEESYIADETLHVSLGWQPVNCVALKLHDDLSNSNPLSFAKAKAFREIFPNITCLPFLMLLSPEGKPLFSLQGPQTAKNAAGVIHKASHQFPFEDGHSPHVITSQPTEPSEKIVEEIAEVPLESPLEESSESPVEESLEGPREESLEPPSETSLEKPLENSSEVLFEDHVEDSLEGPTDSSLEGPSDSSLEGPSENPLEGSLEDQRRPFSPVVESPRITVSGPELASARISSALSVTNGNPAALGSTAIQGLAHAILAASQQAAQGAAFRTVPPQSLEVGSSSRGQSLPFATVPFQGSLSHQPQDRLSTDSRTDSQAVQIERKRSSRSSLKDGEGLSPAASEAQLAGDAGELRAGGGESEPRGEAALGSLEFAAESASVGGPFQEGLNGVDDKSSEGSVGLPATATVAESAVGIIPEQSPAKSSSSMTHYPTASTVPLGNGISSRSGQNSDEAGKSAAIYEARPSSPASTSGSLTHQQPAAVPVPIILGGRSSSNKSSEKAERPGANSQARAAETATLPVSSSSVQNEVSSRPAVERMAAKKSSNGEAREKLPQIDPAAVSLKTADPAASRRRNLMKGNKNGAAHSASLGSVEVGPQGVATQAAEELAKPDKAALAIRLLDGALLRADFTGSTPLSAVFDFIDQNRTDGAALYVLRTSFPHRLLDDSFGDRTLRELDLCPRSLLALQAKKAATAPTAAVGPGGSSSVYDLAAAAWALALVFFLAATEFLSGIFRSSLANRDKAGSAEPRRLPSSFSSLPKSSVPDRPDPENATPFKGGTVFDGSEERGTKLRRRKGSRKQESNTYFNGNSTEFKGDDSADSD